MIITIAPSTYIDRFAPLWCVVFAYEVCCVT
jgi:hypothetical protein